MINYRMNRPRKKAFKLSSEVEKPLDLYQHLPFQIAVVSNLLQLNRDLNIRSFLELEPRELRVILNIGSYMPITSADIAYQCRLDSYTVSRAVKTLRQEGMIDTLQSNENKKSKYLVLTEKGLEIYQHLSSIITARTEVLESIFSENEKNQLMDMLARLEDKTEETLASMALEKQTYDEPISADQKEVIRWWKKSSKR